MVQKCLVNKIILKGTIVRAIGSYWLKEQLVNGSI